MNGVLKGFAASLLMVYSAWALGASVAADTDRGMRFRCETDSTQQHYCKVDTSDGITLVKQLSKIPCMQGRNWDYDRHGYGCRIGVEGNSHRQAVRSNATQGPLVRCEAQATGSRMHGGHPQGGAWYGILRSECIRDLDWAMKTGIWVARDVARIQVGVDEDAPGQLAAEDVRPTKIYCESTARQRQRCDIPVETGVELFRQVSKTHCVQDQSWGWDSSGIWVDHGCRAEFSVR